MFANIREFVSQKGFNLVTFGRGKIDGSDNDERPGVISTKIIMQRTSVHFK